MADDAQRNLDEKVVQDFGSEWSRFDQSRLPATDFDELFAAYFSIFPWQTLPPAAVGADVGCGSGRWARGVAPRVGTLHCVDPAADALASARVNLAAFTNCVFHNVSVDALPFEDASLDFAYSLGVLHHLPRPQDGLAAVARKLKPNAPLLVYLYYAFDNRPAWFRGVWKASDLLRRAISRMPRRAKQAVTDVIAAGVYFPLARTAALLEQAGVNVGNVPLSEYRHRSFYTMRTDSLDRFGTTLEHRVTRAQLHQMMSEAGLVSIEFRQQAPFWVAVAYRAPLSGTAISR